MQKHAGCTTETQWRHLKHSNELISMKQVYLNVKNAAFLNKDWNPYIFLCLQIKYFSASGLSKFLRKFEIWTRFWTKLVILDGQKMTFWTECLFSP